MTMATPSVPRFLELVSATTALDAHGRFFTSYMLKVSRADPDGSVRVELISRRYKLFQELNDRVRRLPRTSRPDKKDLPHLTGKKFWTIGLREDVVEKRKRKLPEYLREMTALGSVYPAIGGELTRFYDAVDKGLGDDDDDAPPGHDDDAEEEVHVASGVPPSVAASRSNSIAVPPPPAAVLFTPPPVATPPPFVVMPPPPVAAAAPAPVAAVPPTLAATVIVTTSKCLMCDRMITLRGGDAGPNPGWDVSSYCSKQCAAFHDAAAHKGFALVTGGDGKKVLSTASEAPAAGEAAAGGSSSWWGGGGRRGSASEPSSRSGSLVPAQAGAIAAAAAATAAAATESTATATRRSLLSSMLGRGASIPEGSAGSDAEDGSVAAPPGSDPLSEAEVAKRNFESRRRSVRNNRVVLERFRNRGGGGAAARSSGQLPPLPPSAGARASLVSTTGVSSAMSTPVIAPPPAEPSTGVLGRMFGFGGASHDAPPAAGAATGPRASVVRVELIHHRGMMWKRGATGLKTWKIRFFELKDWSLYYYRTSNHVLLGRMQLIAEPSQAQLLAAASELRNVGGDVTSHEFADVLFRVLEGCYFADVHELTEVEAEAVGVPAALVRKLARPLIFALLTPDRELLCGCASEEEYAAWVNAIRRLVRNEQQRLLAIVRTAFPRVPRPAGSDAIADASSAATSPSMSVDSGAGMLVGRMDNVLEADVLASSEVSSVAGGVDASAPGGMPATTGADAAVSPFSARMSNLQGLLPRQRSLSVSEAAALVAAHATTRRHTHTQGSGAGASSMAASGDVPASASASLMSAGSGGGGGGSAAMSKMTGLSHQSSMGPTVGSIVPASAFANTWEIAETDVEVVDRIGGGNFGEVYRGRLWGTEVAVKLLISAAVTPDVLDDLKAEVAILSQLRHPNVVLYLGACTTPPNIFIVTEWCERGSLHSLLYDHTVPMSVANRLGLALQTAQGMCYLHAPRRKIIHRDLKSHNLLVTRDFTIKVADFGLTIMRTPTGPQRKFVDQQIPGTPAVAGVSDAAKRPQRNSGIGNRSGGGGSADEEGNYYGIQGTPQWMAPEVLEGQRYNGSVDVYSFGVVLTELASRILPFSDTYKRFDFIDAVLEEGAMPTIPRWCGDVACHDDSDVSGGEPGDDDTSAVTTRGLPWGWNDDLDFIASMPPPPPGAPVPLLGGVVFIDPERGDTVHTPPPMPRKTSQDSDTISAPGGTEPHGLLKRMGTDTSLTTPASVAHGSSASAMPKPPSVVLGGVREWRIARGESTGVLRMMIESCLNRDPDLRPAFEEVVDLLRAVIDRPVTEVFQQLEVPRLREALAYGDDTDASVAANEIIHFASYALFCNMRALPDAGALAFAGPDAYALGNTSASRIAARFDPPEADDPAAAAASPSSAHLRGLTIKFQPFSTSFLPLLAFAPPPGASMSQMHSMPYVDLATVQIAAPQLLAGVAARLRSADCYMRSRFGLPLYCPDLSDAVAVGKAHGGYTMVRWQESSSTPARVAVFVATFNANAILTALAKALPPGAIIAASGTSSAPGTPAQGVQKEAVKRSTTMARAAARRAAAQEEDEKKRRRAAVAAAAHLVHALGIILNVLDAGEGAPSAAPSSADGGAEMATREAGYRRLLPPANSTDRLIVQHASRLLYPLTSLVVLQALSHVEYTFVTRPTGGDSSDWKHRYRCVTELPTMPDFGTDAPVFAATLLRHIWMRLPMLRTAVAHIMTVTTVAAASTLGHVQILAQKISPTTNGGGSDQEWFSVQVPEETVQARFFGVILQRMCAAVGVEPGNRALHSVLRRHPLLAAVEARIKATTMKRVDGIIVNALDVDEFDSTLY